MNKNKKTRISESGLHSRPGYGIIVPKKSAVPKGWIRNVKKNLYPQDPGVELRDLHRDLGLFLLYRRDRERGRIALRRIGGHLPPVPSDPAVLAARRSGEPTALYYEVKSYTPKHSEWTDKKLTLS